MKLDTAALILEMVHERSYYEWHPSEPSDDVRKTAEYLAYCVRVKEIVDSYGQDAGDLSGFALTILAEAAKRESK